METEKIISSFLETTPISNAMNDLKDLFIDNIDIAISKTLTNEQSSVDLEITSNNVVSAESIKLYNVLKFSQADFLIALTGLTTTCLSIVNNSNKSFLAVTGSLLALVAIFKTNLSKKYSQIDSEVLSIIYFLQKPSNIVEIQTEYETRFSKKINDTTLEQSINLLIDYQTIRFENNLIHLHETIKLRRV